MGTLVEEGDAGGETGVEIVCATQYIDTITHH